MTRARRARSTIVDIINQFSVDCKAHGVPFDICRSMLPIDSSTVFCSSGMQRYKHWFEQPATREMTLATVQPCIRMRDIDLLGDGAHRIYFKMLGLFSFRHWDMKQAISFWVGYLAEIGLTPDTYYVTLHPDRAHWAEYLLYDDIEVRTDPTCYRSDGKTKGYCVEFYCNGLKIGNIINPLHTCIDAGFGFERLDALVNKLPAPTEIESLIEGIDQMVRVGIKPMSGGRGAQLRILMQRLHKRGGHYGHAFFVDEVARAAKMRAKYEQLKSDHIGMPAAWWHDVHDIDLAEMGQRAP